MNKFRSARDCILRTLSLERASGGKSSGTTEMLLKRAAVCVTLKAHTTLTSCPLGVVVEGGGGGFLNYPSMYNEICCKSYMQN